MHISLLYLNYIETPIKLTKLFIVDYNNTFVLIVNQRRNHNLLCVKYKSDISRVYSNVYPKNLVAWTGGSIPEMACHSRGFTAFL
jgi:hypothetical protein